MHRKVIALAYHDIILAEQGWDVSGFPGKAAARYKLKVEDFRKHLQAIKRVVMDGPVKVSDVLNEEARVSAPVILTFDDGGASGFPLITDMLARLGWPGHFFINTKYVNTKGFLTSEQILSMRRRGHVIGTHSHSHPAQMWRLKERELTEEWSVSRKMLSEIVGEEIGVASVPGGYYSKRVAAAAALAGIKILFTSEPTVKCKRIDGCWVLGRFAIFQKTSDELAGMLASGRLSRRVYEWLFWNLKKVAKRGGGDFYLELRKFILELGARAERRDCIGHGKRK